MRVLRDCQAIMGMYCRCERERLKYMYCTVYVTEMNSEGGVREREKERERERERMREEKEEGEKRKIDGDSEIPKVHKLQKYTSQ